jgi:5-hydroxyisourate hydrolase
VTGRLTTHVLDTSAGRPAAGLGLALYRLDDDGQRALLVETRTDADGRVGAPLLEGEALRPGVYELVFEVGEHFARRGTTLVPSVAAVPGPSHPFLDQVPVRFGVADGGAHYHVPLLVTPWSYTTYRGS